LRSLFHRSQSTDPTQQVVDFIGLLFSAQSMGNLAKGLMHKAWRTAQQCFQQSYPQKIWITPKGQTNQQLTCCFKKFLDHQNWQILKNPQALRQNQSTGQRSLSRHLRTAKSPAC
jgi:hypothetical protein